MRAIIVAFLTIMTISCLGVGDKFSPAYSKVASPDSRIDPEAVFGIVAAMVDVGDVTFVDQRDTERDFYTILMNDGEVRIAISFAYYHGFIKIIAFLPDDDNYSRILELSKQRIQKLIGAIGEVYPFVLDVDYFEDDYP